MEATARAAGYALQSGAVGENPKSGAAPTPTQQRRALSKARRPIAQQIRAQEAKVRPLRGAAKKSAQAALDKLRALMPGKESA